MDALTERVDAESRRLPEGLPRPDVASFWNGGGPMQLVLDSALDAFVSIDSAGRIVAWNRAAERLFGWRRAEAVGAPMADLIIPERFRAAHHAGFARRLQQGVGPVLDRRIELEAIDRAAREFPVELALSSVEVNGERLFCGFLHDISERREAERSLREVQARFQRSFYAAPIGMAMVGVDGAFIDVNLALAGFLGRSAEELRSIHFQEVIHPEEAEIAAAQRRRVLAGEGDSFDAEHRYLRPDGTVVWGLLQASLLRDPEGEPLYFVVQVADITERREADEELQRYADELRELALIDPLSGLASYRAFEHELEGELERLLSDADETSIVLFDVDRLGAINEAEGRKHGDQILRRVGAVLAEGTRERDLAARIGGDEFALLLPGEGEEGAREIASRLVEAIAGDSGASISFGVVACPQAGRTKELVMLRADMDLQESKPRGGSKEGGPRSALAPGVVNQIERVLGFARAHLDMDVAFLGELGNDVESFRVVEGDGARFGLEVGDEIEIDGTYCRRMVDGSIGNVVADASAEPEVANLPVTASAGIGSYIGVPVRLASRHFYGALCAVSGAARPDLGGREVAVMEFLAELVGEILVQHDHDVAISRAEAEITGIGALMSALEARDQYTGEHSKIVVGLATAVAQRLGLTPDEVAEVQQVAVLHDIGKVGVPDAILQKRGALSESEWELMRQHPVIGERILTGTDSLAHLAAAVRAEHERIDGTGYPDGLRGDQIPIASRISLACDAYHAMISDRPYRAAMSRREAELELKRNAGTQFDGRVVMALLEAIDDEGAEAPQGPGTGALVSVAANGTEPAGEARPELAGRASAASAPVSESRPASRWRPEASPNDSALGQMRCQCQRCGAHCTAIVSRATVSGSCGNCGSYELDPLTGRD